MKLRVYSDIHLDWYSRCLSETRLVDDENYIPPFWYPPELPDDKDTTLILAGDLWVGTKFIEYAGFSWIGLVAPRFKQVLIVLGNHDYWPDNNKLTIKTGATKCNMMLQDFGYHNVHVLDMDTFEVDDYLFVGATLWTDMNKSCPLTMHRMPNYMSYDGKIAYSTGDYGFERFHSEVWVREHHKHKNYIKIVAEQNKDKKIIVISHHLPLNILGDPQYADDGGNGYYMSDLSDLILDNPHIKLWCYGHVHYQYDNMFGDTRMLNNCVGYQGQHMEQRGLVKHEVIEL